MRDAERIRLGEAPRHTYQEAVVHWTRTGFGGVGENTADRYRTSLRMLHPHFGALYIDQVTRRAIGDYVRARSKAGASNATIRRDITALSRLLSSVIAMGWIDHNPARDYDRSTIKERRDPIVRPDPASINACIAVSRGRHRNGPVNFGPLIGFLRASGLRLKEAALIRRSDVDWAANQVTVRRKGNRVKVVDLSPEAMQVLRDVPASLDDARVFWGLPPIRQLSRAFQDIRLRAAKRARRESWIFRPFRLHDLRHEYAISFLQSGGSIYDLQQHLGHTSVRTTEMYCEYLTPEEARRAKRYAAAMGELEER